MQVLRSRPHFSHQWCGIFLCILFAIILLNHVSPTVGSSLYEDWNQVRYSELLSLNASCSPWDSCTKERPKEDNLKKNSCLCDKTCATYDVCCLDSPYRFYRPIGRPKSGCFPVNTEFDINYGVLMVNQCRSDYEGDPRISELCSGKAHELNDPILLLPVTNNKTGISYKNYFCAACNDDVNRLHNVFWKIQLISWVKNISQSELINLKFDPEIKSWTLPNINGTEIDDLYIIIYRPSGLGHHIKDCPLPVTSDCMDGWTDDDVRRKCASYMALMNFPKTWRTRNITRFRNIHCAMCNGLTSNDSPNCGWSPNEFSFSLRPGLSFALLLDINRSDGDRVGSVQRCSGNEIYDPFYKRCRVLKCALPGYKIKDGNCARQ